MYNIYFLFYLVALVISTLNFKKYADTPLRYFPLLIAYTLFNEVLGYYIIYFEDFSFFDEEAYNWHNVIIYNIYQLIFMAYIFWLYYKVLAAEKHKKIVILGTLTTFTSYGISLFFQDPFHSNLYYADCVACVLSLLIIGLHFIELKKTKKIYRYNTMLWIDWGMLIYNLYFPIYILNGYLNPDFYREFHLREILWVVICVMYSLFIIGFVLGKRRFFK